MGLSAARNVGIEPRPARSSPTPTPTASSIPTGSPSSSPVPSRRVRRRRRAEPAAAGGLAGCRRGGGSPGGPTHVLLDDWDAEHIPGCNMAFRRASSRRSAGSTRSTAPPATTWTSAGGCRTPAKDRLRPAAIVWHSGATRCAPTSGSSAATVRPRRCCTSSTRTASTASGSRAGSAASTATSPAAVAAPARSSTRAPSAAGSSRPSTSRRRRCSRYLPSTLEWNAAALGCCSLGLWRRGRLAWLGAAPLLGHWASAHRRAAGRGSIRAADGLRRPAADRAARPISARCYAAWSATAGWRAGAPSVEPILPAPSSAAVVARSAPSRSRSGRSAPRRGILQRAERGLAARALLRRRGPGLERLGPRGLARRLGRGRGSRSRPRTTAGEPRAAGAVRARRRLLGPLG